ncbi:MAG: hypothetical protein ACJ0GH_04380 [Alphaproteobacteria bacterium]
MKELSKKDSSINLDFCLKDTKSFRENVVCQQDNLHKSIIENALGFIVFYVIAILFIAFLFQLSQKKFNSKEKK